MEEIESQRRAGYHFYAPGFIFFDKDLSDGDIIVYMLVSNLTYKEGYCWATNNWLAKQLDKSAKTIQRSLAALAEQGYIRLEFITTDLGVRRKIWITSYIFEKKKTSVKKKKKES